MTRDNIDLDIMVIIESSYLRILVYQMYDKFKYFLIELQVIINILIKNYILICIVINTIF